MFSDLLKGTPSTAKSGWVALGQKQNPGFDQSRHFSFSFRCNVPWFFSGPFRYGRGLFCRAFSLRLPKLGNRAAESRGLKPGRSFGESGGLEPGRALIQERLEGLTRILGFKQLLLKFPLEG